MASAKSTKAKTSSVANPIASQWRDLTPTDRYQYSRPRLLMACVADDNASSPVAVVGYWSRGAQEWRQRARRNFNLPSADHGPAARLLTEIFETCDNR
jgi:hypothetical protein